MTKQRWDEITRELMERWNHDKNAWREQGDHEIGSLIRDGIGDVERLLGRVDHAGDEHAVIKSAIALLRTEGAELRRNLTDDQDEWTAPILLDTIERLQSMLVSGYRST